MSSPRDTPRRLRWHHALHLVWAVPLAMVASFFPWFMALLSWCGISGCSGGGFGRISDPDVPVAVLFLVVAAVLVGLPFAAIPWTRHRWVRWVVALVTTAFAGLVGYAMISP